ncbi:hypothetical protein GCM10025869_08530 [Homoserinibacter gongjuensis]|uniref:Apea-like HEPN domain-containing protein n=2 Tax=Homoserinibacter gongjuensis TaxID=1162968 RepID=A0ABQ6JSP0_9MICO|nr:hypothetical protein GCM10025869_08530 [Homoserinibacter gongjuensis]
MRSGDPVHWYSAEPLPLGRLMTQAHIREAVVTCLSNDPVAKRIRVAARWYAQAHYAENAEDSALALGVGMDAMLTARQPLPGSAMADRIAWLVRDPAARSEARRDYLRFFGVRSAVAHGASSSKLHDPSFLPDFFNFVTATAWRLLDLHESFHPTTDAQLDDLFESLRLGTTAWPAATA